MRTGGIITIFVHVYYGYAGFHSVVVFRNAGNYQRMYHYISIHSLRRAQRAQLALLDR